MQYSTLDKHNLGGLMTFKVFNTFATLLVYCMERKHWKHMKFSESRVGDPRYAIKRCWEVWKRGGVVDFVRVFSYWQVTSYTVVKFALWSDDFAEWWRTCIRHRKWSWSPKNNSKIRMRYQTNITWGVWWWVMLRGVKRGGVVDFVLEQVERKVMWHEASAASKATRGVAEAKLLVIHNLKR